MLRSAISRPTRSWLPSVTGRWRRYQSTGVGQLQPGKEATPESSSVPKAENTSAEASASAEAQSAKTDDQLLDEALLDAFQHLQAEEAAKPTSSRPEGYDGPVFDTAFRPNGKYNPAELPIVQDLKARYNPVPEEEWSATLVHGRSMQEPVSHKPIYNIPVANIHFRSYDPKSLDFFCHFASHAAASLGIPISKVVHLPTQRSLWTVPRSPFAHKKSQENFERRTYKRAIKAWDANPDVVDLWCQYLRTHAKAGVGMKVTRWDRVPLGFGATRFDFLKKAMEQRATSQKVKTLADKIVEKETPQPASPQPAAASAS